MSGLQATIPALVVLFALILLGGGVLVWLAPVPADQLTPAQTNLIFLGDTMVKGAIGAILGFAGARLAMHGGGRRAVRSFA